MRPADIQATAIAGLGVAGDLDGQDGGVDDAQPGDAADPQLGSTTSPMALAPTAW
jgi:hypothetical protein